MLLAVTGSGRVPGPDSDRASDAVGRAPSEGPAAGGRPADSELLSDSASSESRERPGPGRLSWLRVPSAAIGRAEEAEDSNIGQGFKFARHRPMQHRDDAAAAARASESSGTADGNRHVSSESRTTIGHLKPTSKYHHWHWAREEPGRPVTSLQQNSSRLLSTAAG